MAAAVRDAGDGDVRREGGPLSAERLVSRLAPGGTAWAESLPDRVERLARRWDLTVVRPLSGDGTAHSVWCLRGTVPVVVKVVPDPAVVEREHAALTVWAPSRAVVRVLEVDFGEGALLLEGLEAGAPAHAASAERVVALLSELHRPAPEGFPPLSERVDVLFALLRRRRPGYYDRAHAAALELAEDPVAAVLLHGDLHPDNVVDAGARGLVAIDPWPCVGDAAFDAVDFAFAGGGDPRVRAAELAGAVDPERLVAWCRALSVFSPAWQRVIHPGGG